MKTIRRMVACGSLMVSMASVGQTANPGLHLKLQLQDHQTVSMSGSLQLTISIANTGDRSFTLYNKLLRGHAGGLVLRVTDDVGKEIVPDGLDDDLVPPPEPTSSANERFVTLYPDHMWGRTEEVQVSELVKKPGIYHLTCTYQSPLPKTLGHGPNFWGRERPPLKSNVVDFTVR
jgi:hypothetical protein